MKNKKLTWASLSSLLVLALTSCDTKQAADNISGPVEDTIENVLPNLYVALAPLGAFLVMVFVFFKFCYKPIKKRLQLRADHVKQNVDEAREKNLEADRNKEVSEMNIKDSHVLMRKKRLKRPVRPSLKKQMKEQNRFAFRVKRMLLKNRKKSKEKRMMKSSLRPLLLPRKS